MSYSKAPLFEQSLYLQSVWCKLQSHPARRKIIEFILNNGPATFYDINQHITELAGPTVSQHILYLIRGNIITVKEKYPKAIYTVNEILSADLAALLINFQERLIQIKAQAN